MWSKAASDLTTDQLARLFIDAYNKSFGNNIEISPGTSFEKWCSDNCISIPHSHVFMSEDHPSRPIGIGLIGKHPEQPVGSILLALGVEQSFGQQDNGSTALNIIIHVERGRGMKTMDTAAIKGDVESVGAFQNAGFRIVEEGPAKHQNTLSVKEFPAGETMYLMRLNL